MLLHELQNFFENSILHKNTDSLNALIYERNISASQRLQIYRNNHFSSLTEALTTIFPCIEILIGKECMIGLAKEYISSYHSDSGDMREYGKFFPDFLQDFAALQMLTYLADVARLEWACHEVFHEKDDAIFDVKHLKLISPDHYNNFKFQLCSASRLVSSQYSILSIWKFCQNQNDANETLNLDESYDKVLIIRRHNEVMLEKLSDGEFALLSAFKDQREFKTACIQALQTQSDMDIPHCLQNHIVRGTIINFDEGESYEKDFK